MCLGSGASSARERERNTARDIFPLGPAALAFSVPAGHSRSAQQRAARVNALDRSAGECAWALNFLYGAGQLSSTPKPSAAQEAVWSRIRSACQDEAPPPLAQTPEAALAELLGSRAVGYDANEAPSNIASFDLDRISWPKSAGRASLKDCLPRVDRDVLVEFAQSLDATKSKPRGRGRCYWDPALRGCSSQYLQFVSELKTRNMLNFFEFLFVTKVSSGRLFL